MDSKRVRWTMIITERIAGLTEEDMLAIETFRPVQDSKALIAAFDGKVLACKGVTEHGVEFRLIDQEAHV